MKNEKEMVKKNIELSAEFSRYLFEHPEIEKLIPADGEIVFLPEFDQELKKYNVGFGKQMEVKGEKVVYVVIKTLRPKTLSRIKDIQLQSVA